MSQILSFLAKLFLAHHIEATSENDWLVFPEQKMAITGSVVREIEQSVGMLIQIDVCLAIASGRTIVESFAGLGITKEEATLDALKGFVANDFHVLLNTFFVPEDKQVLQEDWTIGDTDWVATIGDIGARGATPAQSEVLYDLLDQFYEAIKKSELDRKTHWVRLYFAQSAREVITCEILLDNEVWQEVQSEVKSFAWPVKEEFYSVRLFLTLQLPPQSLYTPEGAVSRLFETIAANPEIEEDEIFGALSEAGIEEAVAERAFKFTQIAFGRKFLEGMGIQFSSDYFCFDSEGEIWEKGRLEEEPYFRAGSLIDAHLVSTPAFEQMALTSSEVQAVNNALNGGSKPENLAMGPAFLFSPETTPEGMERAREVINQQMQLLKSTATVEKKATEAKSSKPWWRIWN